MANGIEEFLLKTTWPSHFHPVSSIRAGWCKALPSRQLVEAGKKGVLYQAMNPQQPNLQTNPETSAELKKGVLKRSHQQN